MSWLEIFLQCNFYWWRLVSSREIRGHHRGSELQKAEDLHCASCDTQRILYTPEGCDSLFLHFRSH